MRKLKIFALFGLLYLFTCTSNLFAQANVKHFTANFVITDKESNESHTFSASVNQVLTPGGNVVKSLKIKVSKDHPIMQDFDGYPNRLFEFNYLHINVNEDDSYNPEDGDILLTDAIAKLNKSGNLTITFHMNGAGTYLPRGW